MSKAHKKMTKTYMHAWHTLYYSIIMYRVCFLMYWLRFLMHFKFSLFNFINFYYIYIYIYLK